MSLLSKVRPFLRLTKAVQEGAQSRGMSDHRTFPMAPSKWQWNRFKDHAHYYVLLGVIPCTAVITYANVFIGPATLCEIPKGYEPKYWEYYRNPVTRFLAKYLLNNPQQDYEKYLAYLFTEFEKKRLRQLEEEIVEKMRDRDDYQAYYYRPVAAKYHRITREVAEQLKEMRTD